MLNETMRPKISVVAFKPNGKYYTERVSELTPEHTSLVGDELKKLIIEKDPETTIYCPIQGGWDGYYFLVKVDYTYMRIPNFCYFMFDAVYGY